MKRECQRWASESLKRDMELLVFGHGGARALVFPTALGRFYDWEDHGLVGVLRDLLERGWLQLFCVDSIDGESWYAKDKPAAERARRHEEYDAYLLTEVLPFTLKRNSNPFLIVVGADFGGYHALNFGLRHPEVVNRILSMSGLCDLHCFADGQQDANLYFNNPCAFVPGEQEPSRLEALREQDIILAVGRNDPVRGTNEQLSQILWSKDVWHALRIWDGVAHDWPAWERMLRLYIGGHD